MSKFKSDFTFEKRQTECNSIRKKFPDRIPIIVEVDNSGLLRAATLPEIDKSKYLVPDMPFSSFVHTIRKRMKLDEKVAIFLSIKHKGNTIMPVMTSNTFAIYDKYKDDDGFLYISVVGENVFG